MYRWLRSLVGRSRPLRSRDRLVFVISAPRSGSTWLKQALNAHPEIVCVENRLFGGYFDVVQDDGAVRPRLRVTLDAYVEALAQHALPPDGTVPAGEYRDELIGGFLRTLLQQARKRSGKPIVADKITPYLGTAARVIDRIGAFAPEARVVHLVRDGRDVVTSGVFHWLNKSLAGRTETEAVRRRRAFFAGGGDPVRLDRMLADEDLDEWCGTWREVVDAMTELARRRPVLQVRYEDMIRSQPEVLSCLCEFVGAAAAPAVLDRCVRLSSFERMSGGRRRGEMVPDAHVRNGLSGDWRNYFTRRDGLLFQQRCGAQLRELGYETREEWAEDLPEHLPLARAS